MNYSVDWDGPGERDEAPQRKPMPSLRTRLATLVFPEYRENWDVIGYTKDREAGRLADRIIAAGYRVAAGDSPEEQTAPEPATSGENVSKIPEAEIDTKPLESR